MARCDLSPMAADTKGLSGETSESHPSSTSIFPLRTTSKVALRGVMYMIRCPPCVQDRRAICRRSCLARAVRLEEMGGQRVGEAARARADFCARIASRLRVDVDYSPTSCGTYLKS